MSVEGEKVIEMDQNEVAAEVEAEKKVEGILPNDRLLRIEPTVEVHKLQTPWSFWYFAFEILYL